MEKAEKPQSQSLKQIKNKNHQEEKPEKLEHQEKTEKYSPSPPHHGSLTLGGWFSAKIDFRRKPKMVGRWQTGSRTPLHIISPVEEQQSTKLDGFLKWVVLWPKVPTCIYYQKA